VGNVAGHILGEIAMAMGKEPSKKRKRVEHCDKMRANVMDW
jgi:hypothetical protein